MSYFQDNSSQYVVFSRFLLWAVASGLHSGILKTQNIVSIENRIYIYIREELNESLGMNFFSPFQPEREFKVYKSCKCSQIMCSRVH